MTYNEEMAIRSIGEFVELKEKSQALYIKVDVTARHLTNDVMEGENECYESCLNRLDELMKICDKRIDHYQDILCGYCPDAPGCNEGELEFCTYDGVELAKSRK